MSLENIVRTNPTAPHKAIIWLEAEVHEVLQTGECSGMPVYKVKRFPVYIDGMDQNIAVRKLNEFLAGVKEQCPIKKSN